MCAELWETICFCGRADVGAQVRYTPPWYMVHQRKLVLLVSVAVFAIFALWNRDKFMRQLYATRMWSALAQYVCIAMLAGGMYIYINGPPMVGMNPYTGAPAVIAPQQQMFGMEWLLAAVCRTSRPLVLAVSADLCFHV